jgi:PAS domain S-box-containing protein
VDLISEIFSGFLSFFASLLLFALENIVVTVIFFSLAVVIFFIVLVKMHKTEDTSGKNYNKLVHELNQVSGQSDIVINAIADGVAALDGRGTIQLMNPAGLTMLGWDKNDAIGLDYKSVFKLLNTQDKPPEGDNDTISRTLATNQTSSSDNLLATTSSGKKFMISLMVSPIGQFGSGVIVVFRDITETKTEQRQQTEFISTASHEMRTPIAAIEGYLGLALNPATAIIDDKARVYITKAHESAQHLGRLFQDLLDISKADDGRLKLNPVVVDIVTTVRDIAASLEPSAKAKGLVLVYEPDTGSRFNERITPVFYSYADSDHLREIVSNLIENAIKYTPSGSISVNVNGDENHVIISVHDTGLGIPAEDLPHLFQKFYRVDNSATREIGGTGLGLYLSRRLTETMRGRIWVESEFQKGSTFYVEFPRLSNQEATEKIEASSTTAAQIQA